MAQLGKRQLQDLTALTKKYLEQKARVEELEAQLKEAKAEFAKVEMEDLPNAMELAGVDEIKTDEGIKVAIKDDLTMSIPKAKKFDAYRWLRDHELGELIKNTITVALPKGTDKKADALEKTIQQHGFTPERDEAANTTSVKAALKKRIMAGDDVPFDTFGIYKVRKAVVSL